MKITAAVVPARAAPIEIETLDLGKPLPGEYWRQHAFHDGDFGGA